MGAASLTQHPSDYGQLFEMFYRDLVYFTKRQGIASQDAEDCVSRLFVVMIEKDVLSTFDPDLTTFHDGELRHTSLKAFVTGIYRSYLRGYRDRIELDKRREPLVCDLGVDESGTTWLDLNAPEYETTSEIDMADRAAAVLRNSPARVFAAALDSLDGDKLDKAALARKLHMTKSTIDMHLHCMENTVREALA